MRGLGSYDLDRDGRYIKLILNTSALCPSPTIANCGTQRIARCLSGVTRDMDAENPKKTTSFYLLR